MKIRQDKDKYNIGANIRKIRNSHKLTQEETVAKMQLLVEISRGSYAQLECGLYNIKVSELLALAQIFNVSINEFFDGMEL